MLPSLTEPRALVVGPAGIVVCRNGRQHLHSLARVDGPIPDAPEALAPLLEGMASTLPRGATVDLELANAWVRFRLVSFPAGLRAPADRLGYLRALFQNVHGDAALGWEIVWEPGYHARPVLACAVDAQLLSTLRGFVSARGARLRSIEPRFCGTFNRLRPRLNASQGALIQFDGGTLCVGVWRQRQWLAIRSAVADAAHGALAGSLLRQILIDAGSDGESGRAYVCGAIDAAALDLPADWECDVLPDNLKGPL